MEDNRLQHPLIPTTSTSTVAEEDEFKTILYRLILVFVIAVIAIWANYEASKGFNITIINDVVDTPAGLKFDILFVSNYKASQIVIKTSEIVEKILYSDESNPKKPIDQITVKLTGRNLTHPIIVNSTKNNHFFLHISSSVMEEDNVEKALVSALQRGMARVWLWDGEGKAPESLIDGMVVYVGMSAGFVSFSGNVDGVKSPESDTLCWEDKDQVMVAHFLTYCEGVKKGFVGRLNGAMQDLWSVKMVDEALGMPAQQVCMSYRSSLIKNPRWQFDMSASR